MASTSDIKWAAHANLLTAIRELRRLILVYGPDTEEADEVRDLIRVLDTARNITAGLP